MLMGSHHQRDTRGEPATNDKKEAVCLTDGLQRLTSTSQRN
jgi:hypothetical protein